MIAKIQEENVQILLTALGETEGDLVATKWLGVLSKKSDRYRRQRRELCKLSEEEAEEAFMTG
jgi:hypothetical protein